MASDQSPISEEGDFEDRRFYFVVVSISTESEQSAECDRKNGAEFHRANEAILTWTKVFTEGSIQAIVIKTFEEAID